MLLWPCVYVFRSFYLYFLLCAYLSLVGAGGHGEGAGYARIEARAAAHEDRTTRHGLIPQHTTTDTCTRAGMSGRAEERPSQLSHLMTS